MSQAFDYIIDNEGIASDSKYKYVGKRVRKDKLIGFQLV